MSKIRSPFLAVHLWLCVPVNTLLPPSGPEESCGLWSAFVSLMHERVDTIQIQGYSSVQSGLLSSFKTEVPSSLLFPEAFGFLLFFWGTWGRGWVPPVVIKPLSCHSGGSAEAWWACCCLSPLEHPFSWRPSCSCTSSLWWQQGRGLAIPPRCRQRLWPGWPQSWNGWAPGGGRHQEELGLGGSASGCCGPGQCAGCLFPGCSQHLFARPVGVGSWSPSSSGPC